MTSHEGRGTGWRDVQRLIRLITFGLAVAAVVKEVRTPPEDRQWHGVVVGFVPYDFRMPTLERVRERVWDPEGDRVINPRVFGVGWTLNAGKVVALLPSTRRSRRRRADTRPAGMCALTPPCAGARAPSYRVWWPVRSRPVCPVRRQLVHRCPVRQRTRAEVDAPHHGGPVWARSRRPTAPRSSTRTGARVSRSSSATAGRCRPTTGTPRCCSSCSTATASSRTTGAVTDAPRRRRDGHDMDHYADDLAALTEHLDLHDADPRRALDRRRRGRALHRPARREPRRQGGADQRGPADHGADRRQPRRPAEERLRRAPGAGGHQPVEFYRDLAAGPVLRLQPARAWSRRRRSSRTGGARG